PCPFHAVLNRATDASPTNTTLRLPPHARLGRRGPSPATSYGSHHPPYARLGRRGPSPATSCGSHHPPYARLGRRGPSPATSCGSHHRSGAYRANSARRTARPLSPVHDRTPMHLPTSLPSRSTRKTVGVYAIP